jgi:predicted RNA-binding protein with EMAP domain
VDGFEDAFFAFLYPEGNTACSSAVEQYSRCLCDTRSFQGWTLERLVACLAAHSSAPWIRDLRYRYLDFSRLTV